MTEPDLEPLRGSHVRELIELGRIVERQMAMIETLSRQNVGLEQRLIRLEEWRDTLREITQRVIASGGLEGAIRPPYS